MSTTSADTAANDQRRQCPVCGDGSSEVLATVPIEEIDELTTSAAIRLLACTSCGMVFNDVLLTQAEVDEGYEQHSKYADAGTLSVEHQVPAAEPTVPPWDDERLRETARWLGDQLAHRDVSVLDAGCSTGALLAHLRDTGFQTVVGIDPSPAAIAVAAAVPAVRAVVGSFVTPPSGLGRFDLVTLAHTLEHLLDVEGAIASMHALLVPEGRVYIEVPDAEHYADHLAAPLHDVNTEHINHFSLEHLRQLMSANGFVEEFAGAKIVKCSPVHPYPAIFGLWRRSANRQGPRPRGDDGRLRGAIARYLDSSAALMGDIDRRLTRQLEGSSAAYLWGAGQLSMKLLAQTHLARHLIAVVDTSTQKQGLHIGGLEIVAPESITRADAPIVVGSVVSEAAIRSTINRLDLRNRVIGLCGEGGTE